MPAPSPEVAALFISDLHIDASRPAITEQFLTFLDTEAKHAEALYILGDLFESWVGDDAADAAQAAAIAGLYSLTSHGVQCFVMHGNRDFLLADRFCRMSGAELLPDPLIVTLYGEAGAGHARRRAVHRRSRLPKPARNRAGADWQRQFLALSVASRRALADAARVGSQAHTAAMEYAITDVNADSVAMALRRAGTATLLHGHTHRPAIHTLEVDGRPCTRIVLGDWYDQGSLLRWDHNGPELVSLSR